MTHRPFGYYRVPAFHSWLWVFFLVGFAAVADAVEMPGGMFAPQHREEGIEMTLQGTGVKTVAFFKAFAAGFYQKEMNQDLLLDAVPKRIEVEYFVNIPGKKLNNYTIERMKLNINAQEFSQIKAEIALMGKYFVDLNPGDRFSLTFIPGIGTKFAHNGRLTGIIKGDAFARALFAVWIGEKPFDEKLKRQILGEGAARQEKQDRLAGRLKR